MMAEALFGIDRRTGTLDLTDKSRHGSVCALNKQIYHSPKLLKHQLLVHLTILNKMMMAEYFFFNSFSFQAILVREYRATMAEENLHHSGPV